MSQVWLNSIPVLLAAGLAVLGALALELRDQRDRLVRVETKVDLLLEGHKVVEDGPGS